MIVTVTPNPSIDRTVTLGTPLTRGAVHRVTSATTEPGGKGVNVARALTLAGLDAVAVLPAADADPIVAAPAAPAACPSAACRSPAPCAPTSRSPNPTAPQPNSTSPAPHLDDVGPHRAHPRGRRRRRDTRPGWCCPAPCRPACPTTGTPTSSPCSRPPPCRVAVDTSERPLDALAAAFGTAAPDVIKPNAEELAGLVGASPDELEHAAAAGDPEPGRGGRHASSIDRGANAVLVTLGAAGAVLVDQTGSWMATPPPITPRSTVGAGDSVAGRLRPRRGRRRRAAATPADGRRLRQRGRRAARLRTAVPRADRSRMPFGCMRLRPHPPVP